MILLWGLPEDPPLAAVHTALREMGKAVILLDQHRTSEMQLCWKAGSSVPRLLVNAEEIDLAMVTAAYLRPYDPQAVSPLSADSSGQFAGGEFTSALCAWADLTRAVVLNPPSAMASNSSKPWQSALIQKHGFHIPATLITNAPAAAKNFWRNHGTVIYKSISGHRSKVSRLSSEHKARWDQLRWCPTQFQEYIPGVDFRVHVVGENIFACEIISSADDYRYPPDKTPDTEMRACDLPTDVAERCLRLATSLKLPLTGIDLRRTPDGEWYCFEVNPSPAFSYYQSRSGQPIDQAIANLLCLDSLYLQRQQEANLLS